MALGPSDVDERALTHQRAAGLSGTTRPAGSRPVDAPPAWGAVAAIFAFADGLGPFGRRGKGARGYVIHWTWLRQGLLESRWASVGGDPPVPWLGGSLPGPSAGLVIGAS